MATNRSDDDINPGEAKFIVEEMVRERRISKADLKRYRRQMAEEIDRLTERLKNLSAGQIAAGVAGVAAAVALPFAAKAVSRGAARKAVRRVTAAVMAGRQLQGRYISLVRQFPQSRREEFSKIAKEQGREAAIKAMTGVLGETSTGQPGGKKRGRKGPRKAR